MSKQAWLLLLAVVPVVLLFSPAFGRVPSYIQAELDQANEHHGNAGPFVWSEIKERMRRPSGDEHDDSDFINITSSKVHPPGNPDKNFIFQDKICFIDYELIRTTDPNYRIWIMPPRTVIWRDNNYSSTNITLGFIIKNQGSIIDRKHSWLDVNVYIVWSLQPFLWGRPNWCRHEREIIADRHSGHLLVSGNNLIPTNDLGTYSLGSVHLEAAKGLVKGPWK